MELKYKILSLNQGKTKKGEIYYRVLIYANWSANILNCFVTKEVYELIEAGTINDNNVNDCLTFKFANGKIYLSINIK